METKDKILTCMNRAFGIDNANEETSQENCETWDSMNQLNFTIELEEMFGIELEPEDIGNMVDFASVYNLVVSKL